jgi:L-asparaginase
MTTIESSSGAACRRIVVLGTGGTIAGLASEVGDALNYVAAQQGIDQLLQAILPHRPALQGCELCAEQVAQVDSKDMDFAVWLALLVRASAALHDPTVRGLLITHGTDTMEETAYLLQAVLQPHKPVVLTGAMRAANAVAADGPQNLLDALTLLHDPTAAGVMLVCAGVVHSALDVRKSHPYRWDAFDSGDAGPVAYVEEAAVRWLRHPWASNPVQACTDQPSGLDLLSSLLAWPSLMATTASTPRVDIVTSHADADGRIVDLLVQDGVRGLVVAGTGNGTVHRQLHAALCRAQAAGVHVWRTTRCAQGQVLSCAGDGLFEACRQSPAQARIALMLHIVQADCASARNRFFAIKTPR